MMTLLGKFHPLVVHFPIALVLCALAFVLLARFKKVEIEEGVRWVMVFAALSAILSSGLGWIFAEGTSFFGAGAKHLFWHRWLGISSTVVLCILAFVVRQKKAPYDGVLVLALLALVSAGVSATGHFGGVMVYGDDHFSTVPKADTLGDPEGPKTFRIHEQKNVAQKSGGPQSADLSGPLAFKHIRPLFKQSCFRCHNAQKRKGGLRLDTLALAFKGGESGTSIVAGDKTKSELFKRISLPQEHEDYMPSKGRPLTKEEVTRIGKWIDEGAR